jgi:hypothetical protein
VQREAPGDCLISDVLYACTAFYFFSLPALSATTFVCHLFLLCACVWLHAFVQFAVRFGAIRFVLVCLLDEKADNFANI